MVLEIGRGSRSRTCFLMLPRHPSPLLRPHRVEFEMGKWWTSRVTLPVLLLARRPCYLSTLLAHRWKTGTPPWCRPRQGGFWRPSRTSWCAACYVFGNREKRQSACLPKVAKGPKRSNRRGAAGDQACMWIRLRSDSGGGDEVVQAEAETVRPVVARGSRPSLLWRRMTGGQRSSSKMEKNEHRCLTLWRDSRRFSRRTFRCLAGTPPGGSLWFIE